MATIPPTSRRSFLRQLSRNSLALSSLALCSWDSTPGGSLCPGLFFQPANGQDSTDLGGTDTVNVASRVARGKRGVVATVHPLASQAAMSAFARGGNAVDAAVAASLMLSVVDGHNSGLGGGCLALVHRSDESVMAFDGRETAPVAATPEMFFRNGQPAPEVSQIGALAVGVPGLLSTLERLSREHGQIDWNDALLEAAEVAENGFVLTRQYAQVLAGAAKDLRRFPSSARVLLNATGQPWNAGQLLRQTDLAQTLRHIAQQGVEWFYHGEFAERATAHLRNEGGLLAVSDFAKYETLTRRPIQTQYRQRSIIGFPPPSSGGIHTAQMLGMLADFPVAEIFAESPARGLHLLLEVMKRAMADRAYWLGDADFAKVPFGLLDPEYLHQRASSIQLDFATEVSSHGQPPRADIDLFGKQLHTTHLSTADELGNVVAITQTVNTSFGCKMIVPGTGVVLNNQMDDFSIAPGVRNAFGLIGSEANRIAPGKRPLSSMSPTIVIDEERQPLLTCGAAGGPRIISAVLQVLVRTLDLGQSIEDAIEAPRLHHQWSPDVAVCERAFDEAILKQLVDMGHQVQKIDAAAVVQGISRDGDTLTAVADVRAAGSALGF